MISPDDFAAIAALDLDSIKAKLMHKKSGKGWSAERAAAVEREYRRFLYLMKRFPNEPTAPLVDVDTFWHYHILDTLKYAADCQQVFGYFLHHFPYVGMRGKDDEEALQRLGERMRAIYEETFGEDYLAGVTAGASLPKPALSSGINLGAAYGAGPRAEASAAPAYCTRAIGEAAYCTRAPGESAYCTRPALEAAYCIRAAGGPAYCTVTIGNDVEAAEGTLALAEAAYCTVTNGSAAERLPILGRLPEQRAAFYLERPRLPQA